LYDATVCSCFEFRVIHASGRDAHTLRARRCKILTLLDSYKKVPMPEYTIIGSSKVGYDSPQ